MTLPESRSVPAKVRVLELLTSINVGGAELQTLYQLRELDPSRYEITVAYLQGNGGLRREFEAAGMDVVNLGMRARLDPIVLWRLLRLMRKRRFDVVHCHLFRAEVYGCVAAALSRVPIVLASKHNDDDFLNYPVLARLHYFVSTLCQRIIVPSEHVKAFTTRVGVDDPGKLLVIPYGVPELPEGTASTVRRELSLDPEMLVIGTVGRLVPQKGQRYLLEAMRDVRSVHPRTHLLIVGVGRLRDELLKYARKLGIADRVIFTGFRQDIQSLMAALDVFALPSLWEGFGLVLLEAMLAGKPVVASRVSAIPEIVVDGVTGVLVPPMNSAALAEALTRLLQDERLRLEMGEAGRQRVRHRFSIEASARALDFIYAELTGHGRRPVPIHEHEASSIGGTR